MYVLPNASWSKPRGKFNCIFPSHISISCFKRNEKRIIFRQEKNNIFWPFVDKESTNSTKDRFCTIPESPRRSCYTSFLTITEALFPQGNPKHKQLWHLSALWAPNLINTDCWFLPFFPASFCFECTSATSLGSTSNRLMKLKVETGYMQYHNALHQYLTKTQFALDETYPFSAELVFEMLNLCWYILTETGDHVDCQIKSFAVICSMLLDEAKRFMHLVHENYFLAQDKYGLNN